jgi:predicted AlkP superfamily pyrophosphatase or phosphodiesterase
MRRLIFSLLIACAAFGQQKPKLVVAIVIDQFPETYLQRFRTDYHGGIDRMLREGAVFTNARYQQSPTVTAVGHSLIMSGAMPSVSGIVGNSWYDRDSHMNVTSVCDPNEKVVGGPPRQIQGANCNDSDPASPRRLLVSSVGDEMKIASKDSHVVGISIKARSAIMPSGHMSDGAFWFDSASGNFISSTFFFPDGKLPKWVEKFNEQKRPAHYVDQPWPNFPTWNFRSNAGEKYAQLPASPWGNELIEAMAEAALEGEHLGHHAAADLLTVSFSSNDYVGHQAGPDSPEVKDMAIRTDQLIGKLFARIGESVGLDNVTVVLTADHGVAPIPDFNIARRMPAGTMNVDIADFLQTELTRRFGEGKWIENAAETSYYFNQALIQEKKLDRAEVSRVAAEALITSSSIHPLRVYTREQLLSGVTGDFIAQSMMNGFYPHRAADLYLLFEPGWLGRMRAPAQTSHSTPYAYDTNVPVIFWGRGIRQGVFHQDIAVNDIAPTITTLLQVGRPNGASGRALTEILK